MRELAALFFLSGAVVVAGPSQPAAVERAQREAEKVRELVEAGALPRARLEQAGRDLADARDDDLLRHALYGLASVEDLTEEQIRDMNAAAERRVARQREKLEQAKRLVEAGVSPRTALSPLLEELDSRRKTMDLAVSRANFFRELTEMVRREQALEASLETEPETATRIAERFEGAGAFRLAQLRTITAAFEKEFHSALPVSARGMTQLHKRLGFDHRERADVSLRPDQPEGVWLRRHLEALKIPYIAFRGFIAGVSTAPHIHIGPPSGRLRAAD
jgi:hypothetical protein